MNQEMMRLKLEAYADKIFFFCIKRCNTKEDAEDLSQIIFLELIQNNNRGIHINNYDFYVWQVAKNQYARYQKQIILKKEKETRTSNHLDHYASNNQRSMLDEMIQDERIKQINQGIKLLSLNYATILYAYYVEDKTIKQISQETALPLGTVKRKLFEIRNKLKEYLKMERLNGKKAYIPKDVHFVASGIYKATNPWNGVRTLMEKNILFHSYNNLCSLEDYAIEMGIALPYIEDIVEELTQISLLKKVNNKYRTDFVFLSVATQDKCLDIQFKYKDMIGASVQQLLENHLDEMKNIGFVGNNLSDDKLFWMLSQAVLNIACWDVYQWEKFTARPGGGCWDFLGFEHNKRELDKLFVGNSGGSNYNTNYTLYDIREKHIVDKKITLEFMNDMIQTILYIYNHLAFPYSQLEQDPKRQQDCSKLLEKQIIRVADDKVYFNILIFNNTQSKAFRDLLLTTKEMQQIKAYLVQASQATHEVLKQDLPAYLQHQLGFVVDCYTADYQGYLVEYLLHHHKLYLAETDAVFPYHIIINCG